MSKRSTQHVVPSSVGGWNVKRGGAERATKHFDNKDVAIGFARQISRNQEAELVIHGKNGKIQRADSHGNDPHPPRG